MTLWDTRYITDNSILSLLNITSPFDKLDTNRYYTLVRDKCFRRSQDFGRQDIPSTNYHCTNVTQLWPDWYSLTPSSVAMYFDVNIYASTWISRDIYCNSPISLTECKERGLIRIEHAARWSRHLLPKTHITKSLLRLIYLLQSDPKPEVEAFHLMHGAERPCIVGCCASEHRRWGSRGIGIG